MRYIRRRDPNLPRFGVKAPPEDLYGVWTCPCGHVVRRGENYGWRGGELRCEKCLEEGYASEN